MENREQGIPPRITPTHHTTTTPPAPHPTPPKTLTQPTPEGACPPWDLQQVMISIIRLAGAPNTLGLTMSQCHTDQMWLPATSGVALQYWLDGLDRWITRVHLSVYRWSTPATAPPYGWALIGLQGLHQYYTQKNWLTGHGPWDSNHACLLQGLPQNPQKSLKRLGCCPMAMGGLNRVLCPIQKGF